MTPLAILRIGSHAFPPPSYARPGDAGLDLRARIDGAELWGVRYERAGRSGLMRLHSGGRVLVPCGFAVALPAGTVGLVCPRSSAFRVGYAVRLGVVDAGYRGEIRIGLENHGDEPVDIAHGDRIAQLVIAPVARCEVCEVGELDATARGAAGFGSTGR